MRGFWIVSGLVLLFGAGGGVTWILWRQPEVTPPIRGEAIALRLGCFGCHGPGGSGEIADPTSAAGKIPGWSLADAEMFVRSEQEIREWILYGESRRESAENMHKKEDPLVPMPAYEEVISERELDDLVAYFRAVSGWDPDIPDAAFEGRKIASRVGCFGCHGPSGMGGTANPRSFKGHIPPWDGKEFDDLVRDDQELLEWILDGQPRRLRENWASRYFLERQKIPMPAYRDYLSDDELNKLVVYIHWLRKR